MNPLLPNEWIEIAKLRHPGVGIRLTAHKPSGVLSVARKQSGPGFTLDYLAMAIAVVLSYLNRIVTFFVAGADLASTDKVRHRAHRQPDPSKRQPPSLRNSDRFSLPRSRPTRRQRGRPAEQTAATASFLHSKKGPASLHSETDPISAIPRMEIFLKGPLLRGQDLNLRPLGYEPSELPNCSTPRRTSRVSQARMPPTGVTARGAPRRHPRAHRIAPPDAG